MTAAPAIDYPRNQARDISEAEPYRRRWRDLEEEGKTFRQHWSEIEEFEFPRRGRWLNGGNEAVTDSKIYSDRLLNNTALTARQVVASGLKNGLTPSTRDWYGILPEDEELRDDANCTWWLSKLKKRGQQVMGASNFYSEDYGLYEDAAAFGTAAMLMEKDDAATLQFIRLPNGSYWPETNAANQVNGLARRFALSSENLLKEFGRDALPARVTDRLGQGHYYDRETVIQFIRPVDPDDSDAPEWAEYESVYFLEHKDESGDRILARRYYRVRPFIVLRWSVDDGTPYGARCPGMDCLGDCRQLQAMERKKLRAVDMSIDPPVKASQSLFGSLNRRPGTVTWVDSEQERASVEPLMQIRYDINQISADIERTEKRIDRAHHRDFFLSLQRNQPQMTAKEVIARAEERVMILGPMIERFNYDMLEHVLNFVIDFIMFHGLAGEPPEELRGRIKYKFTGPLAMILEEARLGNITQWLELGGAVANYKQDPSIMDRYDGDEIVEIAARVLDVDEACLVPLEKAKQLRAERDQAAQQAAGMRGMLDMAKGVKDLSQADVGGANILEAAGIGAEGME